MEVPIESVDDLADQTAIEYGTMHGGSTMTFFQVRGPERIPDAFIDVTPSPPSRPFRPRLIACLICFPSVPRQQSLGILLLREMRRSHRRTLSPLITSGLDLRANEAECERNRVTRGETVKHGMEGSEESHYPCLTLNLYINWTINKSD